MKLKIFSMSASIIATLLVGMTATQPLLAEEVADVTAVPDDVPPIVEDVESAEEAAMREALESVQDNRDKVVAELSSLFGAESDEAAQDQLEAALQYATSEQLLAAQSAQSLDEVNAILAGTAGEGEIDLASATNHGKVMFVPVTPCRIVNTTKPGAGGLFAPGNMREYYVHGNTSSQGGTTCTSPVGEPKGVAMNITAVPQPGAGGGNFVAYPANVSAPNASVLNYKYPGQNIGNAVEVKTWYAGGNRDIEVKNSYGYAHLVIDVLGYFTDATNAVGATQRTTTQVTWSSSSSSPTEVVEKYVYMPEDAYCHVTATGTTYDDGGSRQLRCEIQQDTNSTPDALGSIWVLARHSAGTAMTPLSTTRFFSHPAGGRYYRLACTQTAGGSRFLYNANITVACAKKQL